MPDVTDITRVRERIQKSQAALESFARIAEEFKTIRSTTPTGPARDRIDGLLKLNTETLDAVRRSLDISEGELRRRTKNPDGEGERLSGTANPLSRE